MYKDDEAWMARITEHIEQAKRYVRFCIKIYEHQKSKGRYLLHKHLWLATSWFLPEMDRLAGEEGVQRVRTDMCQFGMMSRTAGVGSVLGHVLKPTGFLTNSRHIARELSRRCPRDHDHWPLVGGSAAAAAMYPHDLCCAICRGLYAQIKEDTGFTIESPLLDKGGIASLSSLRMEATTAELNDMYKESGSTGGCLNEVAGVSVGDHVLDLFQNAKLIMQMLCSRWRECSDRP